MKTTDALTQLSESKRIETFYEKSKRFCSFVNGRTITHEDITDLLYMLTDLYATGLTLADIDLDVSEEENPASEYPKVQFEIPDFYRETYYAFHDEDIVGGSLSDNLGDIYYDLQLGIRLYEAGRMGDAVFEWNLSQSDHWGWHAVDAIRALHQLRSD